MILALKLFLTPFLIAAATLTGRRWGPGVSGWLIGFPLTSGPIALILALQQGPEFAAQAAIGNLGGLASICAFCLVYTALSHKKRWLPCAVLASTAYFLSTYIWNLFTLSLLPTLVVVLLVNILAILMTPQQSITDNTIRVSKWDLPVRMIIAVTFVILLTTFASALGPQLSGLITPFPVFGTVLAVFAHRQQGAGAAIHFLRGHMISLFGFAGFFWVVSGLLTSFGIGWTFILATLAAVAINGISLKLVR